MWRCVALLQFVIKIGTIDAPQSNLFDKMPLWSWECRDEKCVPMKPKQTEKLQSWETCNMLCTSMNIWPQPTGSVSLSTTAVPVRGDLFQLQIVSAPSRLVREMLKDAFDLFKEDLRKMESNARGFEEWRSVIVRVFINGSSDPRMKIDTDEQYRLSLRPKDVTGNLYADIAAHSFCGARHALETLLQLVWLDPYAGSLLILEAANVNDSPKFHYRGLLVDTARNFLPIDELMQAIDAMAISKLNTFHWHVSDAQSFSLQLNSLPQLSEYGAYSAGDVYVTDEVRALVRRARLRGIRVLIEVDLPARIGRAWIWGQNAGVGNLSVCQNEMPWTTYCEEPPCGQLNPRNKHIYELIKHMYAEIIQLTGVEDIFHLGGSDIAKACWEKHFEDIHTTELWAEYTKAALQHLTVAAGILPNLTMIWSSHLNDYLKSDLKEFILSLGLQVRSTSWAQKYVAGLRTVVSHEDVWDLNSGMGSWYEEKGGSQYNSWQRMYDHRPWVKSGASIIIGGEATVWSHNIGEGGLNAHAWPRGAAFAERLWSDRAESATRPVYARLNFHRARLVSRGIPASPLWSMWCTQNAYTCS